MPGTGPEIGPADAAVGSDIDRRWAAGAIALAIVIAAVVSVVRARAGTADLWYDDAWVALSTRVPIATVNNMGVSAPGFTFVVRWWLGLRPGSIGWAQTFALIGLVVSPVVIYLAARIAGAARWAAATVACLTALNPILLAESSRVKQYTWEYALSAAMVAVAAAVRRDGPTTRLTFAAAVLVVVATMFSGSMAIPGALLFLVVVAGLWTATRRKDDALPRRAALERVAALAVAGAIVVIWAAIYLLHPPAALSEWWRVRDGFLGSGTVAHTAWQAYSMVRTMMAALIFGGGTVLIVFPLAAVAWFVWHRWRRVWWLLMAGVFAVVLSATQRYPLGARGVSRIEAWLLPWAAVILALTFTEIGAVARIRVFVARLSRPVTTAAVALIALALVGAAWQETHRYPTVRAQAAVDAITAVRGRGTGVAFVADENFSVALLLDRPIRIVDDNVSTTGWTIAYPAGPRVLHLDNVPRAVRELRSTCGRRVTIAGATRATLAPVLPRIGCRVVQERVVQASGGAGTWDGIIVLRLGAARR